jgi:predicted PurR-regulated permease PerM
MNEPTAGQSPPPAQGVQVVPAWLANLTAAGWRVLVVAALLVVVWYLSSSIWNVLASIGLAIIVAVILAPLVLRLRAGGRSRNSAAGLAWAATVGIGIGVLALLAISLVPYLVELVERLQAGQEEVSAAIAELGLPAWASELLADLVSRVVDGGGDAISSVVGSVANLVGILVLATFLLFFFLRDGDKAWRWLFQWVDEEKRERIDSAGDEALSQVGIYVRARSVLAVIAAITNLLFMLVLGAPLALPLALLTLFTAYIPYFGGIISAFVIVVVTWGAVGQTAALAMAGLILLRFVAVWLLVRPRVSQDALALHPVVILIVLPIGFQIGGLAGLVLAVPLTAFGFSVAQAAVGILAPEIPENLPETVPAWLDGAAQWSWRTLVVIGFVALLVLVLVSLPLVVLPVIVALILAATVMPLADALIRRGQSRTMSSAVAVGGSTAAIVGVLALSVAQLADQADDIGRTASEGAQDVDEAAGGYLGLATDALDTGVDTGVSIVLDITSALGPLTVVLVLSALLTFYFVRDGGSLWNAIMSHLPSDAAAELSSAGSRAFGVLGGYMTGTGAISLVGAGSQAVIMWILNLPLVLPVFVLSFFGGYIPYIGSALTTGLAFLIAVAVGDTIDIIIMLIWTLVFNIVQGNVVAPLVYNRTTHIHPAIVLAAIPAGSAIAGILGMFLVVPVLGVVTVSWRSVLKVLGTDVGEPMVFDDEGTDADTVGGVDGVPLAEGQT